MLAVPDAPDLPNSAVWLPRLMLSICIDNMLPLLLEFKAFSSLLAGACLWAGSFTLLSMVKLSDKRS